MRKRLSTTIAALALAIAPSAAWADGYFVPFIGANFGGDVGRPLSETVDDRNRFLSGFGVGGMAGGTRRRVRLRLHAQLLRQGRHRRHREQPIHRDAGARHRHSDRRSDRGGRPSVLVAGAGLLRRDLDFGRLRFALGERLGYALGGGVMGYFSDHVGLRGDLRYFRNFKVDDIDL